MIYQHYKGPLYWVLGEAKNANNNPDNKRLVCYLPLYDCEYKLFYRASNEVFDCVEHKGVNIPRFAPVGSINEAIRKGLILKSGIFYATPTNKPYSDAIEAMILLKSTAIQPLSKGLLVAMALETNHHWNQSHGNKEQLLTTMYELWSKFSKGIPPAVSESGKSIEDFQLKIVLGISPYYNKETQIAINNVNTNIAAHLESLWPHDFYPPWLVDHQA